MARALVGAARKAVRDDVPMLASALAYNAFLAIPAMLLLAVGLFSLAAEPRAIEDLMQRLGSVVPAETVTLVEGSLRQLERQPAAGVVMSVVGLALAFWTTTGAATTLMKAVNRAHDLEDARGFVKTRAVAVVLVVVLGAALLAVSALLVLGPHLQRWIGDSLGAPELVTWVWRTARWPILLAVLFAAFCVVYALAVDRPSRRWRLLSRGAGVAVVLWSLVSWAFGVYASHFGSYNKTWGSLSAAIVTMVWLWLSALALLYGAEVDAQGERAADDASALSDTDEGSRPWQLRRAG